MQVTEGRAVLASDRLPQRIHRLAQRRLDGLSHRARNLLVTAEVLGPAFRLEDAAEMLGETPATLLPAVEEAMDAAIMTATEHAFTFRHQLLRRAVGEMTPRPARKALHRQYGEMLLTRGESAAQAASHLLQAAHPDDPASLAGLDKAAAQMLRSSPQTAARLALRALELTSSDDPAALPRAVAAAQALTTAGRLDRAARIARDLLTKPLPSAAEDRLRCAMSSVLCAADQAQIILARPQLPCDLRDQALTALLQALAVLRDELVGPVAVPSWPPPASTAATPRQRPRSPARSSAGIAARLATRLSCCVTRRGTGISADARHVQPLLALAAAVIYLRQLSEAEDVLRAANNPARAGDCGPLPQLLKRAHGHLADPRHEPRRLPWLGRA